MATLASNGLKAFFRIQNAAKTAGRYINDVKAGTVSAYKDAWTGTKYLAKGVDSLFGGRYPGDVALGIPAITFQSGLEGFKTHLKSTPAKLAFGSMATATIGGIGAAGWGINRMLHSSLDESDHRANSKLRSNRAI